MSALPITDEAIAREAAAEEIDQLVRQGWRRADCPDFRAEALAIATRAIQRARPPTSPEQEREDKERLDWLVENPRARYYGPHSGINPFPQTGHAHHLVEGFGNLTKSLGAGSSLRAAIDAARSSQQQGVAK